MMTANITKVDDGFATPIEFVGVVLQHVIQKRCHCYTVTNNDHDKINSLTSRNLQNLSRGRRYVD